MTAHLSSISLTGIYVFLGHVKHSCTSGPLDMLFPLPRIPLPWGFECHFLNTPSNIGPPQSTAWLSHCWSPPWRGTNLWQATLFKETYSHPEEARSGAWWTRMVQIWWFGEAKEDWSLSIRIHSNLAFYELKWILKRKQNALSSEYFKASIENIESIKAWVFLAYQKKKKKGM